MTNLNHLVLMYKYHLLHKCFINILTIILDNRGRIDNKITMVLKYNYANATNFMNNLQ